MRIALQIEYHGGPFCGWQSQPSGCAVQDALERALADIAAAPVSTSCAGRTDTGVHALMQVVHFDAPTIRPAQAWVRGANALLPDSIAVVGAATVPDDFHARFDAVSRTYRYVLVSDPVRPAMLSGTTGWHHERLSLEPMREALLALEGEHDFSAFRAAECQARSPVRRMYRAAVAQQGSLFTFEFRADGFLHHMIRNIIGSVVRIGRGREAPQWLGQLLEGRNRTRAAPTFSPAGLYLTEVAYAPGRAPALPGPRASMAGHLPAFVLPAAPLPGAADGAAA